MCVHKDKASRKVWKDGYLVVPESFLAVVMHAAWDFATETCELVVWRLEELPYETYSEDRYGAQVLPTLSAASSARPLPAVFEGHAPTQAELRLAAAFASTLSAFCAGRADTARANRGRMPGGASRGVLQFVR